MSDRELNKCKKCNSLHEGNGECCGICQDERTTDLNILCPRCNRRIRYVKSVSGEEFVVNEADREFLCHQWRVIKKGPNKYVYRQQGTGKNRKGIYLHHLIADTPSSLVTDHIDGNGLDNCICNLRSVTAAENKKNRIHSRANCRPFISEYYGKYAVFYKSQTIYAKDLQEAIKWRDGLHEKILDMYDLRKITKQRQSRKGKYNYDVVW